MNTEKTIPVLLTNAQDAHRNASTKGKRLLEDLLGRRFFYGNITERITSFSDVCSEMGVNPSEFETEIKNPLILSGLAKAKCELIIKCLNESTGQNVDWTDSNQTKYQFWLKKDASAASGWSLYDVDHWRTGTSAGARLAFLEREHAEWFWSIPEFQKLYINHIDNETI